MLADKSTTIFSEISKYFKNNDAEKAFSAIRNTMNALRVSEENVFGKASKPNCKFTQWPIFQLLLLFPCAMITNAFNYVGSSLYPMFKCHKDMFYRFLSNESYDWRKIQFPISCQLWEKVQRRRRQTDKSPICLIFDDSDFPKCGKAAELIGKVFSHVEGKMILGFKALFCCITDGKSQMLLDEALVGEKGKKGNYGMRQADLDARFSKVRKADSPVAQRVKEYDKSKIKLKTEMIKRVISRRIHFDYVLADSWFACSEVISFIFSLHIKCHYLGMIKISKTKYVYKGKEYTANELVRLLNTSKNRKYSRRLKAYYLTADVHFAKHTVRLFFYRNCRHEKWNGLITTNLKLDFLEAYKIYSMRWAIEVVFKEAKQNLGLGKYQSRDFASQIASTALTAMQYNMLSVAKRYSDYETIGGLFKDLRKEGIELSVTERIWGALQVMVQMIIEMTGCDEQNVLDMLINRTDKLYEFVNFYKDKLAA